MKKFKYVSRPTIKLIFSGWQPSTVTPFQSLLAGTVNKVNDTR